MSEKINFAWPATAVSKEDYDVILNCVHSNINLFKHKKIMIFGAGARGTVISVILESEGYCDILFTDNNAEKWGGYIDRYPIVPPQTALAMREEVIILISTEEGHPIKEQLEKNGLIEGTDFFFPISNLYDKYIYEFKRETKNDILVMGDCMFEVISFNDVNKDSLAEIFVRKLGYDKIKLLTMHGMGMRAFYHVLKAQEKMGMQPDIFIVMINFETLTGKQHLLPRSQHTELIQQVFSVVKGLDDGELEEYVKITKDRVKNIQAEFFTTNKFSSNATTNEKGEISSNAAKLFFKLNYMYKLNPEIESVQYLIKILKYAKEKNFRVIPFIPPVNYELGRKLFGEKFEEAYQHNYQIIDNIVKEHGHDLLDLSHICKKELFAAHSTPDETTNYEGRSKIAYRIIQEIERIREAENEH